MRKRIEIKAVWDSDLKDLLSDLEIIDQLERGTLTCAQCGRIIDLNNIGAVIPQTTSVILVCDNTACLCSQTDPEVLSSND